MHYAALVREGEPVGHLVGDVDRVRRGKRRLQQALAQVGPLEQLHRQVSEVALLAEIVGRDDVRMRELAGGLGLLEKALVVILAALGVVAQDDGLQRDDAVEVRVLGAVDDPHRAATELAEDPVAADPRDFFLRH